MDEGLETVRAAAITAVFETLTDILKDDKVDIQDRLKAAKQIDLVSDTMVHAYLLEHGLQGATSSATKLSKSIDKLHRDHEHGSEQ